MATSKLTPFDGQLDDEQPASTLTPFTGQLDGEKPRTRGLFEAVNDNVIEFANAAAGGVSALANMVKPGNAVSGFIDENIIKAGEQKQSDVVQGAKRQLSEGLQSAQGIGDEVGAVGSYVLNNPLLAASQAAGSFALPGGAVKGAGAAAKALGAGAKGIETAGRVGGIAAGAAMAGGDAAGTAYDLASKAGATEDQAVAAGRQASVIPALVGGVTGAFGAERLLAGAKGFGGNALSRGLKSGLSEAGQEALEEGVTQFEGQRAAMPYDESIDPTKGVAGAAAMGGIMGFGPGAVLGAMGGGPELPSKQMGIDPNAGPLSRAAASAVDSQPVPQPLGASITGTAPSDLMGRATDPLAEQITAGRQKSEDLAVTRNAFADRNSEALAGGGLLGSRADPLANMISDQRSSEASTAANIDRAAQNRAPMTATEAGNMLVAAREQGRNFTVAPHPDGGFVVVPREWVTPQVAAKAEASLMETLGRVAQVEDAPINRAARVSTEPANLNLNTDPVTGYVDNLRSVNTPAARMFVSEFDAGRITRQDVERRMAAERGKTADERIAEAAAQAKKPKDPYSLGSIAQARPEQASEPLIEIPRTNKLKEASDARRAADELRGTTGASTVTGGDITPPSVESPVANVRSAGRNDDAGTAQPDANGDAGRAVGSAAEGSAALTKVDVPETNFGNIESAKVALRNARAEVDRVNDVWSRLYRDGVAYIIGDGPSRKVAPNAPQEIKDRFDAYKKAKSAAKRNYDAASAAVDALTPKKERPVAPVKTEPVAQQEPATKPRQLNGSDAQKAKALFTLPAGSIPRPDNWRGNAIKAGKVARSLGLDPKGKRLKEIVAEIDAVDAGSGVSANPASREQAIRDAWRKEPRTIGKWTPISVEAEGQKADMLVNQKRAGGDKDGALHVVNIRMGKMLKDMEREPIAYTFRLTSDNRLVEEGIPTVATPGQIAAWKGAGFALDDKQANVQNTPQGTAGEAKAPAVEASKAEGGNAASSAGVPAAGDTSAVENNGVKSREVMPAGLTLEVGGKLYPVDSLARASEMVSQAKQKFTEAKASGRAGGFVEDAPIRDGAGRIVGYVGRGGSVFDVPNAGPRAKKLYDAGADLAKTVGESDAVTRPALPKPAAPGAGEVQADGVKEEAAPAAKPKATELTPKQFHQAKLAFIASDSGADMAEVREMYDTEGGRAEHQREWLRDVEAAAKAGETLSRQTLDKLYELAPNVRLPETAAPNGYQKPDARKEEAEEKQARIDNRKAAKESVKAESAAQAEKPAEEAPAPKKAAEKIEDFGEKLAGARKDYAATLKDAMSVDVAAEPLSKSWPEPDYQKLLDGGADPFMVAWVHAARDEIPTKPQTSWKLSGWVKSVTLLRKVSADLLSGDIAKDRLQEMLEKPEYGNLRRQLGGRAELYQAVGHVKSLKGITFMEHHYSMYRNEKNVTKWSVEMKAKSSSFGGWPREIAVADTKADALAQFKEKYEGLQTGSKSKGAASFVIYRKRGEAGAFIGKKIGREYIDLHKAEDVKAARTYLADNTDKLEKALERYKDTPYERGEENAPRVGGDHRNGAPVTPEVFGQTFGFRGVQFGNYVEQGRRQSDLNEAFDALMDMAAVLGIPPKAISLNGRLGLAFGARGKGGKNAPAAHYETGNMVINLTKGGGPGSLAHEWFHAMDNYFAKQGGDAGYMTDGATGAALREEMRQAFKSVKTAINAGALKLRSLELDKRRTKPYWSTPVEMAARSFESYVIAKLQDQNASNDYLANVVDQKVWDISEAARAEFFTGQKAEPSYPYPTVDELPALRAAFDDFFKVVQTRETEDGNTEMYFGEEDAPIFYSALRKEIEGMNLKSAPFLGWHGQLQGLVRAGKVKADELEWTGITEWLKLQTGKVSKDDVLAFLDANGVQVTETVLSDTKESDWKNKAKEKLNAAGYEPEIDPFGDFIGVVRSSDGVFFMYDGKRWADEDDSEELPSDIAELATSYGDSWDQVDAAERMPKSAPLPKYSQYTLPGGENYREVLLTLPVKVVRDSTPLRWEEATETMLQAQMPSGNIITILFDDTGAAQMQTMTPDAIDIGRPQDFDSVQAAKDAAQSMVSQRSQDVAGAYTSSHWDQPNVLAHIRVNDRTDAQGRKVLFVEELQSDWSADGRKKGFAETGKGWEAKKDEGGRWDVYNDGEYQATVDAASEDAAIGMMLGRKTGIPRAPFVENTDKWLALSLKRIMKMAVDGGYDAVAFVNGEQSAERYDLSKQVSRLAYDSDGTLEVFDMRGDNMMTRKASEDELADLIGKETAQRLIDAPRTPGGRRSLEGDGLKVGGEGMKAFYDKIVPAAVKDVLKKVGGGQLETFSLDGKGDAEVSNYLNSQGIEGKVISAGQQLSFSITDKMREKVAGGLPLFAGTKDKSKRQGTPVDRAIMDMAGEGREANEILSFIAKSSKSPYRRQLAQKLLATGANPAVSLGGEMGGGAGFRFLAKYSRKNHEVTLSEAAADRAEQIFLHETVHSATLLALDKGGLIATQMRRLAANVYKDASPEMRNMYGLVLDKRTGEVNVGEFVAEAFTNPQFQKALKGMKADNGSLWDRLVNIVRRILGMEPRQQDALSKALELGAGVMRENMPLRAARSFRAEDAPAFAGVALGRKESEANRKAFLEGSKVRRVVYHATRADFNAFDTEKSDLGAHFGNIEQANRIAGGMRLSNAEGTQVMPVWLSIKNPLRLKDVGTFHADGIADQLERKGLLPKGEGKRIIKEIDADWKLRKKYDPILRQIIQDAGYDGVVYANTQEAAGDSYIAFRPEQIKSAIGNNGNFDPDDADIAHFGISDAVEQIKAFDVKEAPKNTWAHYRGMALQALGRRQLVDLYGDEFGTHLHEYDTLVQQMDAEKNETGAEADDIAQRWGKLKDEKALAELMHDATLAKMDPDKPMPAGYSKSEYDKLKTRFNTLSPEAKTLYREARDMYVAHYKAVQQAIKDRIERSEMSPSEKKRMMAQLDDKLFKELQGVYFPLARFGQYVIVVKDANGEVKNVTRAETVKEAEQARKELQKAFPSHMGNTVGKVLKQAEFNAGRDAVGKGFMADLMNALDEKGVDDELRDTVAQLYLSSLPDLSWAKHGIHRKGTPGFSQDARRAFAQNAFHGARYLAKLRYSDRLQDELTGMQDYVKAFEGVEEYDSIQGQQVVDEMVKRHEILMNPKSSPVSTALTSFGFLFHMGLSPASAMVNLTQTALVAFPQMGAKWGFTKAGAALTKASEEVVRAKNDLSKALKGDELAAFDRAVKDGTIDVTMAHDLAGIAQGEDQGVMWKVRPVMRWASFMFHHAEKFNRQATFLAAYRLSKETNQGRSEDWHYEEAKKATYDGHFDYSAANRARIMQGNWQRVILLFKNYSQHMIYALARNAYQSVKAMDPKERTQARKTLGGILAAHAAAAGVLGLPIVGPLLTVASWIGGDDDEPWDAEVAMQNAMAEMIGPKAAEVVARGFSRLTPFDLSGRVALNKLILPDVQEGLEGKEWAESAMAAALGPVAGIGVNMARGAQKITEGDYLRGLEDMIPTALRGPLKALRYANEGAVDKTGIVITDEVSAAGVLGQASGFSPSQVRRDTERRSAIYSYDRALLERRSVLMRMMAEARIQGDTETQAEVQKDIQRFNEKNPTRRITPMNIAQSVRNRRKRIDEAEQGVYLPSKRRDALDAVSF